MRDEGKQAPDLLALPVRQGRQKPYGILVLSGWGRSEFSARRRRRIAGYIVAHIEDVIARDYDELTGLMSYALFEKQLVESCARAGSETSDHFVMCLDIDQLHLLNETFGRETGDEAIAAFAQLLRENLGRRPVTRIASDGFAAFLTDTDLATARKLAERNLPEFSAA